MGSLSLTQRKFILNLKPVLPMFAEGTEGTLQGEVRPVSEFLVDPLQKMDLSKNVLPSAPAADPTTMKLEKPQGGAPKSKGLNAGKAANVAGKAMGAIQGVMGAALMYGLFRDASSTDVTSEEMLREGATGNIDGESFLKINVDSSAAMERDRAARKGNTIALMGTGAATGAAIGSMFGPLGGAIGGVAGGAIGLIGGLFASKKRKREAERKRLEAIQKATNTNERNFDTAYTSALLKQATTRYGRDDAQELYAAKDGYEGLVNPFTMETYKQHKVDTAGGMRYDTQNAWGKKNEWIWNPSTYRLHKINRGPDDDARLHLNKNDVIFTNDITNPFTGKTFALSVPQAAKEGWLPRLLQDLIMTKAQLGFYKNIKNGNLKHAAFGWEDVAQGLPSVITALPGVIAGINLINASKDQISSPKSYVQPNVQKYLNDLESLDINMYPIYKANQDATAISNARIVLSGGLGAGQQMLGYMTNAMNERDAISKSLADAQMQRNSLIANAAKTGIDTNLRTAAQEQSARQWDYEKTAAAHNAKILNNQMGWYNISNALLNLYKNWWNKYEFDKTYKLYQEDAESKKPVVSGSTDPIKTTAIGNIGKFSSPSLSKPLFNISLQAPKLEKYENTNVWKNYEFGYRGEDLKPILRIIKTDDDGKFGRNTRRQLIKWQKANKLKPTGIVDLDTYNKMFLS